MGSTPSAPSSGLESPTIGPGTVLDRYQCLWPIGAGGMASVWAARLMGKHGFEKLVALKTVLPKHTENVDYLKMLLDEGFLLARITHPNVASVIDLGEQDGIFYLVFEWVEGEQLSKLQQALTKKKSPMPMGIALRIVADTCAGLHAAHEARSAEGSPLRLVHRDVSPQNVMITTNGDVKLIDFGIAKALDRVTDETRAGSIKGKIRYMAPEQVRGEQVDRRVDVWAVGVILYQLAAGHPPFGSTDPLLVLESLMRNREPLALPRDVPPSLALPIWKALRPLRDDRYATASDLRRDLERAIAKIAGTVSTSDVAAFLNEHVGDRIEARRKAISEVGQTESSGSCTRHVTVRQSLVSLSECQAINTAVEETLHSAPEPLPPAQVVPIATVSAFARTESENAAPTSPTPTSPSPSFWAPKAILILVGACILSGLISALLVITVQRAREPNVEAVVPHKSSLLQPSHQPIPTPHHAVDAATTVSRPEPSSAPAPPILSATESASGVPARELPPKLQPSSEPSAL